MTNWKLPSGGANTQARPYGIPFGYTGKTICRANLQMPGWVLLDFCVGIAPGYDGGHFYRIKSM